MLCIAKYLGDRREQTATKLKKVSISLKDQSFVIIQKPVNV